MPHESPYPTLSNRLFAAIADWAIVLITASILTAIFGRPTLDFGAYVWLVPWTFVVGCFYFSIGEGSLSGATPMKKLMGFRVVRHHGGRLTVWQAILRQFVKMLPLLAIMIFLGPQVRHGFPVERDTLRTFGIFTAAYALIEFIMMCIKGGRTLHDLAASSQVLRTWGKM